MANDIIIKFILLQASEIIPKKYYINMKDTEPAQDFNLLSPLFCTT